MANRQICPFINALFSEKEVAAVFLARFLDNDVFLFRKGLVENFLSQPLVVAGDYQDFVARVADKAFEF